MDDKGPTGTQQDVSPANLSFVDPLDGPPTDVAFRCDEAEDWDHSCKRRPDLQV